MLKLSLNENITIDKRFVGNEHIPIVVIDDLVNDPELLVKDAQLNAESLFKVQQSDFYPGVRKPAPLAYQTMIKECLWPKIHTLFSCCIDQCHIALSAYSIATTKPQQLRPIQMLPHFDTTDQKWTIESKTNYTLDKNSKNYVYGDVAYEDDRFGSFDNSTSVSAGWGRQWIKNEEHSLFADIGPGYKRDVTKASDGVPSETLSAFIIQAQALYTTKINSHVEFEQKLSAKYAPKSGENSKYKAESSITTKLIETLQLKFSFVVDHNTEVEEGKKKTDTQTAVTLVYSF